MGLMGLVGLIWLMTSCSDSDDEELVLKETEAPVAEVRSFATYFDEYVVKTRAWAIPDGYVAYADGEQSIGIAFTQDTKSPIKGTFYKSGDKWRLNVTDAEKSVEDIAAETYYLYGYIPNTSGVDLIVTDRAGTNSSYSTGATVELRKVPAVMGKDLCVVIGAKHGFKQGENDYYDGGYTDTNSNSQYDEGTDFRTNRLRRGDFAYTAAAISKTSGDGNFVFLLFDHLYAALSINMKVHPNYDALRTIKLKSLKLSTKTSVSTCLDKANITINLQANDGSSSPITEISYAQTGNAIGAEGLSFWSSDAGVNLSDTYQTDPFTGYFMPDNISTLVLTSTYDVYDKNVTPEHPEGNKVRENCNATNVLVLSELLTGQTVTHRGRRYIVNMIIQPTYLYVLSEPDLDNPTVVVN